MQSLPQDLPYPEKVHIISSVEEWSDTDYGGTLCGASDPKHAYLTVGELWSTPETDANRFQAVTPEHKPAYQEKLCADCMAHPDYALLMLAAV